MSEYSGVVQRHSEKLWNNKTFYSFTLSGQDGWFNTGPKKPPAIGQTVAFQASPNAKGYLEADTKTIQYLKDQEPTVATAAPKADNAATGGYWDRKEERDLVNDAERKLGATRNTAIALVDLMLKYEAIKLPAKQADKEAVIWEIVVKYTDKLLGGATTPIVASSTPSDNEKTNEDNWA